MYAKAGDRAGRGSGDVIYRDEYYKTSPPRGIADVSSNTETPAAGCRAASRRSSVRSCHTTGTTVLSGAACPENLATAPASSRRDGRRERLSSAPREGEHKRAAAVAGACRPLRDVSCDAAVLTCPRTRAVRRSAATCRSSERRDEARHGLTGEVGTAKTTLAMIVSKATWRPTARGDLSPPLLALLRDSYATAEYSLTGDEPCASTAAHRRRGASRARRVLSSLQDVNSATRTAGATATPTRPTADPRSARARSRL